MTIAVGTLAAALVAAILGYLGIARRYSGNIRTSDAAELWEASRLMQKAQQERNEYLQARIDRQGERIERLERLVEDLVDRNGELKRENEDLRRRVHAHEETIGRLEVENRALKARVGELEAVNG